MANEGGLSPTGLKRLASVLQRAVDREEAPGLVALVHRRGATRVFAHGHLAFGDEATRMDPKTIFRITSMVKPIIAVAAMILVEECRLRLDDPVDDLLPELANRQVLRHPGASLHETVPAQRAITLRDLLTSRMGTGIVLAPPDTYPIQRATSELGLDPGPDGPAFGPDEWLRRLGSLPLVHQPGERWMYQTSADVLGMLITRALRRSDPGETLDTFLAGRIFGPLGMPDTGYYLAPTELRRIPVSYAPDPAGRVAPRDETRDWTKPPVFVSGAGLPSLLSTAEDYLRFLRMLLDKGRYDGGRILSRAAVELMTTDQLTEEQKAGNEIFLGSGGWGFGIALNGSRDDLATRPGRFGWTGGLGTDAWADPGEDLIGILLTQVALGSPEPPTLFSDFWTSVYAAIED